MEQDYQPLEDFQYQVSEPNEDYKEAVIEKTGIKTTFTLGEIEKWKADLARIRKELEAQIMVEEAKLTNIDDHHPEIKEMEGVKLTAAALYKNSKTIVEKTKEQLASVIAGYNEYETEYDHLMKMFGFVPTDQHAGE